ncbi:hypothetical protein ACTWJ8_40370 (plasmid) [Streptomyces sp. SDT5-1]|uniref:hypothetical protein n=1 Tax=Streptomyces sp. SDT5-1 TaxID=3406418 RepID=UPI003FD109A4
MSPEFLQYLVMSWTLTIVAFTALAFRRISEKTVYGLCALSQFTMCIAGFVTQNTAVACIAGAGAGYMAWRWWTGGGDDDTKRRLRRARVRFHGVRRTAPVSGL